MCLSLKAQLDSIKQCSDDSPLLWTTWTITVLMTTVQDQIQGWEVHLAWARPAVGSLYSLNDSDVLISFDKAFLKVILAVGHLGLEPACLRILA